MVFWGPPCFGDPGSPIYRYSGDPVPILSVDWGLPSPDSRSQTTSILIGTLGPYLTGSLGTPRENKRKIICMFIIVKGRIVVEYFC